MINDEKAKNLQYAKASTYQPRSVSSKNLDHPADTRRLINVGLMLVKRLLRRWTNVNTPLIQRIVSAAVLWCHKVPNPALTSVRKKYSGLWELNLSARRSTLDVRLFRSQNHRIVRVKYIITVVDPEHRNRKG